MNSDISQVVPPIAAAEIEAGGAGQKSSDAQFGDIKKQAAGQIAANPLPSGATGEVVSKLLNSPDNPAAAAGQLTPGEEKLYALLQEVKALLLANQGSSAPTAAVGDSATAAAPKAAGGGSRAPPAVAAAPADGDKATMDKSMKYDDKAMMADDKSMKYGDKSMMDKPLSNEDKAKLGDIAQKNAKELGQNAEAVGASASKNTEEEGSVSSDDISAPTEKGLEAAGNLPSSAAPSGGGKGGGELTSGEAKSRTAEGGTSSNERKFLEAAFGKEQPAAPSYDLGQMLMEALKSALGDGKLTKNEMKFINDLIAQMGGNKGSLSDTDLAKMIKELFMGAEAGTNDLSDDALKGLEGLLALRGAPGDGGTSAGSAGGDSADSGSDSASAGSGRAQSTRAPLAAGGGITGGNILASLYGSYLGGDEVSRLQNVLSGNDAADPLSGTATA
jgi:hypothetical protein